MSMVFGKTALKLQTIIKNNSRKEYFEESKNLYFSDLWLLQYGKRLDEREKDRIYGN